MENINVYIPKLRTAAEALGQSRDSARRIGNGDNRQHVPTPHAVVWAHVSHEGQESGLLWSSWLKPCPALRVSVLGRRCIGDDGPHCAGSDSDETMTITQP